MASNPASLPSRCPKCGGGFLKIAPAGDGRRCVSCPSCGDFAMVLQGRPEIDLVEQTEHVVRLFTEFRAGVAVAKFD